VLKLVNIEDNNIRKCENPKTCKIEPMSSYWHMFWLWWWSKN